MSKKQKQKHGMTGLKNAEKPDELKKSKFVRVGLTEAQHDKLEKKGHDKGYKSANSYLKYEMEKQGLI